jgi:GT2 family glycosyltransferase/predicted Zn-dependent protease
MAPTHNAGADPIGICPERETDSMARYLFGPARTEFANNYLSGPCRAGECVCFDPDGTGGLTVRAGTTWQDIEGQCPPGWRPEYVVLWLPFNDVPLGLWQAPCPVVGLAPDWRLRWHRYRRQLARCDLILTDPAGVEALSRSGLTHARAANLVGVGRDLLELNSREQDIDIVVISDLHPVVDCERLPWVARIAQLAERFRIVIRAGVPVAERRQLMARAKVAFDPATDRGWDRPAFEAAVVGAVLFRNARAGNGTDTLRAGTEYVAYSERDAEALLEQYLSDDALREEVSGAARQRAAELSFECCWAVSQQTIAAEGCLMAERAARRIKEMPLEDWIGLCWDASSTGRAVPGLGEAAGRSPRDAALANAAGVCARTLAEAAAWFSRAVSLAPSFIMARLNWAETLAALGEERLAVEQGRGALVALEQATLSSLDLEAPHCQRGLGLFRAEWERAAWSNAGEPTGEASSKRQLLRWRLHTLLAQWTGEFPHYYEAAVARPDLPPARAALGCALARAGRLTDALPHLRTAVHTDPLDLSAARALRNALGEAGCLRDARLLARDRRLLHRAAPQLVPEEDWFREPIPDAEGLASIVILCCNEVEYTRQCLASVLRHARPPYELILVDNGSSDGTSTYLEEIRTQPGPERVVVIRNEVNRGFAFGVNQGLAAARGEYLVLLNNDTVVTPGWLDNLVEWVLLDYPAVGLVGAVSNYARPPQQVQSDYADPSGLDRFARSRESEFAGKAMEAERLGGFCLIGRRDVFERLGTLDEGYGLGFFEDDDLCVRARRAGYRLLAAQNVYIHHFGSRTFTALGIDTERQLQENLDRFRAKWGVAEATGYRPSSTITSPALPNHQRVSLCMIVRDEERNLPECLRSVRDLVDELIIVDTGSSDHTRDVAGAWGARVFEFRWVDNFSAARNESIRHATGGWIFWMDADDRIDPDHRERLRALFASLNDENAAYVMKCLCVPAEPSGAVTAVDHVRLFRNRPEHRWRYRVHEQILPALRSTGADVRWCDAAIRHIGYADPALRRRKLQRDLRLLTLERAEQPDDPFTLFNLGSVYQEMGRLPEAVQFLRESLGRSHTRDSIVRKLYALIAQCHRQMGQPRDALSACAEGRAHYPDDAELLFVEGLARRELGDLDGAANCLERLLESREGPHFASVDAGLQGTKARHNLAVVYLEQGRPEEAEAQWRACLDEDPRYLPARQGLGDAAIRRRDWEAAECAASGLDEVAPADAIALRARARMERGEFAAARGLLTEGIRRLPKALPLRVLLSHALLKSGEDDRAAEQSLRDILALDPGNEAARHNLTVLATRAGGGKTSPRR